MREEEEVIKLLGHPMVTPQLPAAQGVHVWHPAYLTIPLQEMQTKHMNF